MRAADCEEDGDPERLVAKLRELSAYEGGVTPDLDVVYDLFLGGDDLDDLLTWLHQDGGVDVSDVMSKDLPLNEPPERTHTLFGKRKFKSMTVGGLVRAMQNKRWSWA
ncbi:MAG: hypothetical protein M3N05_03765 [Pseudomonadota bacterium]|nr:hypothetical protein [Pseudomonadota bacterium]